MLLLIFIFLSCICPNPRFKGSIEMNYLYYHIVKPNV
jgi:hypothetical protein